jgi:hypothetical protein
MLPMHARYKVRKMAEEEVKAGKKKNNRCMQK